MLGLDSDLEDSENVYPYLSPVRTSGDSTSVVDAKLVELKAKHEAEVKKMRVQHSNEMNQLMRKHEENLKSRENVSNLNEKKPWFSDGGPLRTTFLLISGDV